MVTRRCFCAHAFYQELNCDLKLQKPSPDPVSTEAKFEKMSRNLRDPGRLGLEEERSRFGWGNDFEATNHGTSRRQAWIEQPSRGSTPVTQDMLSETIVSSRGTSRLGTEARAVVHKDKVRDCERRAHGGKVGAGAGRIPGTHHLHGKILPNRPERIQQKWANHRAPTLVGRYDAVVAEKETEALFAQLTGGGGVDKKAKIRSEDQILRDRAFCNLPERRKKC